LHLRQDRFVKRARLTILFHDKSILPHLLCCGPFAVANYGFTVRRLAFAASSLRETDHPLNFAKFKG
jgi:hypothetical protein